MTRMCMCRFGAALAALAIVAAPAAAQSATAVSAEEFAALRWLEGRWVGSGGGVEAFYEQFRVLPDGTIEQTLWGDSAFTERAGRATIEHRGDDIDPEITSQHGNWIFGCDICQDVCPWNKFSTPSAEARYDARPGTNDTPLTEWEEIDLDAFRERFGASAIKRTKVEGFRRNVRWALENARRAGP